MALKDCMLNRFRCKEDGYRWPPFEGFKPVWEVGKRVQMSDLYLAMDRQFGARCNVSTDFRVPVIYAIPKAVMQLVMDATRYIDRIPYDGADRDHREEWENICKNYSARFLGEFLTSPPMLGYQLAMVGLVVCRRGSGTHMLNFYLESGTTSIWYVDKTRANKQWRADGKDPNDIPLKITL